jgi:hypothetical protein
MALALSEVRLIVQRVCTRPEVLEACRQHDICFVVETLNKNETKVTQSQIAEMTGISQGRLSEYMNHKRTPEKAQLFLDFADGLCMPTAARQALGLGPSQSATAGRSLVPAMREPPDDVGTTYPETTDEAAADAARMWQVDLADPTELTRGRVDPAHWNNASLR